jgi:hypothetical protein
MKRFVRDHDEIFVRGVMAHMDVYAPDLIRKHHFLQTNADSGQTPGFFAVFTESAPEPQDQFVFQDV